MNPQDSTPAPAPATAPPDSASSLPNGEVSLPQTAAAEQAKGYLAEHAVGDAFTAADDGGHVEAAVGDVFRTPDSDVAPQDAVADDAQLRNFTAWGAANDTTPPEQRAKVLRYAAATGLSPSFVQGLDPKALDTDPSALREQLARHPKVAAYLQQNPEKAPLVKDDVENLGGIAGFLKGTWEGTANLGGNELSKQEMILRGTLELGGLHWDGNDARVETLAKQTDAYAHSYDDAGFWKKAGFNTATTTPFIAENMAVGALGGYIGGVLGTASAAAATSETGPGALAAAAAGGVAGKVLGSTVAVGGFNFIESATETYLQLKRLKDADGNPINDNVARQVALGVGFTNGMLMIGPFAGMAKGLPVVGPWLEKRMAVAAENAALKPTLLAIAKRYTERLAAHEVVGAATMGAVGAANQAAQEISKGITNLADGTHYEVEPLKVLGAAASSAGEAVLTFVPFSGYEAAKETVGDVGRLQLSRQSEQKLAGLTEAVTKSKLLARMPEELGPAVKALQSDAPDAVTHAYVPLEDFNRLAQEQGLDPRTWAATIAEDGGKSYQDANFSNSDVVFPIDKYLSRVVGAGRGKVLAQDVKLSQDAFTPRQAKVVAEARAEQVRLLSQPFVAGEHPSTDAVWRDVYERARAAGRGKEEAAAAATQAGRAFGGWGKVLGRDALDLYRENPLRIFGPDNEELGRPVESAPAAPLAEDPFGADSPSLEPVDGEDENKARERATFEALPEDERKKAFALDANTGLYNEEGFRLLPEPADRPFLAEFENEGAKATNDFASHDHQDGALRLMARALKANGIEDGAKLGGAVKAWVASPEQAQAIADAMTKATGGQVKVTHGVAERVAPEAMPEGEQTPEAARAATFKRAADEHGARKDKLRAAGELGQRGGVPTAFSKGLPKIDYEGKAKEAGLDPESPEAVEKFGLPLGSEDAKAALKKAMKSKDMKAALRKYEVKARVEGTPLLPAHEDAFIGHEERGSTFDHIHFRPDGTRTDAGFALARKVNPEKYVVSADARGIKAMNDEEKGFGKKGTDQVLAKFREVLAGLGGKAFSIANPHGDEFFAQGKRREVLKAYLDIAQKESNRWVFVRDLGAGGIVLQEGVQFAYGIGESMAVADGDLLPKAKEEQDAERKRNPEDTSGKPQHFADRNAGSKRAHELEASGRRLFFVQDEGAVAVRGDEGQGAERSPDRRPSESGAPLDAPGLRAGEGGVGPQGEGVPEGSGQLDAAPGAGPGVGRQHAPPTAEMLSAAWDKIDTYKEANRDAAAAWLDYTSRGFDAGEPRPDVPQKVVDDLARFGVVDPEHGYIDAEMRRRMKRGGKRRGPVGEQPAALKSHRLASTMSADEFSVLTHNELKQPASGHFDLEQTGERGYIRFKPADGTGKPRSFDIHLLAADKSTLPHELMHYFSEVMGDLAQQPNAPQPLRDDYAALLKFQGYDSHQHRLVEGTERRALSALSDAGKATDADKARLRLLTAKEERPAYAWEQYLMEGKAPAEDLVGVFATFKKWLTGIYRGLQSIPGGFKKKFGVDLGLNDEVRGVFDRLLASEDEIAKVRELDRVSSNPFAAALEGADPEALANYARLQLEEKDEAERELQRSLAEDSPKEQQANLKARREAIRKEVEQALNGDPAQRALHFLQEGQLPESPGSAPDLLKDENGKPLKLDRDEVAAKLGEDFAATLDDKGVFAKKGQPSAPMDVLAELLRKPGEGFQNGEEMVRALSAAKDREAIIASETQHLMTVRHPTLQDRPQEFLTAATVASHNSKGIERRLLELHRLRALAFPDGNAKQSVLTKEHVEGLAASVVPQRTVGELTGGAEGAAGYYLRAEREARKRAFDAAAKKNWAKAYSEQDAAVINFALYREASKQRKVLERGLDKLRGSGKEAWRTALGKADPAYRNAHDAILSAVGLGRTAPNPGALEQVIQKAQDDLEAIVFDTDAMRALLAKPKAWKDLTASEAGDVLDAVQNLRTIANRLVDVKLAGRRQAIGAFLSELEAENAGKEPVARENFSASKKKGVKEQVMHFGRGAMALLTDTGTMAAKLDQGNRDGPAQRLLVDERLVARKKELELSKKVLEPVVKAFENIPEEIRKRKDEEVKLDLPIPPGSDRPLGAGYTRKDLWALFLNAGNEGNRRDLREGNLWSDEQIDAALAKLSPEEGRFLQRVLDSIGSLRPELAKVHEARAGLPMGEVKASPINAAGEVFPGGYFPMKFDARFSRQGRAAEKESIAALLPNDYVTPFVASGHTKGRVERKALPIKVDFDVVPAHLAQVVHDIAYGDWVRQANRIFNATAQDGTRRWDMVANSHLGTEAAKQFLPWLQDVANARADSVASATSGVWSEAGGFLRRRVVGAAMAFNLPSYMRHLADPLLTAAPSVGVDVWQIAQAYPKALKELVAGGGMSADYALSEELAYREGARENNIRQAFRDIGASQKFSLQEKTERLDGMIRHGLGTLVDRIIWRAAMQTARSNGMGETAAARFADDAVRKSTPSLDLGDKAGILRKKNSWMGALMMYGYRSKVLNANVRAWNESAARGAVTTAVTVLADAVAVAIAGQVLRTGASVGEDIWHRIVLGVTGQYPFVDRIAEAMLQGKKADASTVPEVSGAFDTYNRLQDLYQKYKSGTATDEDKFWASALLALGALGGPVGAVQRINSGFQSIRAGETQGPLQAAGALYHGRQKGQR